MSVNQASFPTDAKNAYFLFFATKQYLLDNLDIQLERANDMVLSKPHKRYFDTDKTTVSQPHISDYWYWRDDKGDVRFSLQINGQKIKLNEGAESIYVGKDKDLPKVIAKTIRLVRAGLYDPHIKQTLQNIQTQSEASKFRGLFFNGDTECAIKMKTTKPNAVEYSMISSDIALVEIRAKI